MQQFIEYLPILFILAIVFKDTTKVIMKLVFGVIGVLFKLIFGTLIAPKNQRRKTRRKKRRKPAIHMRQASDGALEIGRIQPTKRRVEVKRSKQKLTKENPWASGNPGERINPFVEEEKQSKHSNDLPQTPEAEVVKDRAESLPDETVIIRHDVAEANYQPDLDRHRHRKDLHGMLQRENIKSAFLFKELMDKPKALR